MDPILWLTKYSKLSSYLLKRLPVNEVYTQYHIYCIERKLKPVSKHLFGRHMIKNGFRRISIRFQRDINNSDTIVAKAWTREQYLKPCTNHQICPNCNNTGYVTDEQAKIEDQEYQKELIDEMLKRDEASAKEFFDGIS